MKKLFMFCTVILSVFALSSCGNDKGEEKKLEKVDVAEVTHSLFYAPFYVAMSEGFFIDEGLDVEFQTVPGGDKTMTALLSDAVDIALVGPETSIYVGNQNAKDPVYSFAQLTQKDGTFLVARDVEALFDFEDVKGQVFLAQRQGGMPQMVGEYVLKKNQIDPKKDVELIQNIDFGNIPAAFISGTGDFVQLFEPTATIFEQEGRGKIVASFGEESGLIPYTAFMSKESYMSKNPEVIYQFTSAIYQAQQFVEENDAATIAKSVHSYFKETDLETVTMVIDRYKNQDTYAKDPVIERDEWNNLLTIMKEAGVIDADASYDELVNTYVAKKVME